MLTGRSSRREKRQQRGAPAATGANEEGASSEGLQHGGVSADMATKRERR